MKAPTVWCNEHQYPSYSGGYSSTSKSRVVVKPCTKATCWQPKSAYFDIYTLVSKAKWSVRETASERSIAIITSICGLYTDYETQISLLIQTINYILWFIQFFFGLLSLILRFEDILRERREEVWRSDLAYPRFALPKTQKTSSLCSWRASSAYEERLNSNVFLILGASQIREPVIKIANPFLPRLRMEARDSPWWLSCLDGILLGIIKDICNLSYSGRR